jgi:hypothetical protein
VEGICGLAALSMAGFKPDLLVYVAHEQGGRWTHEVHIPAKLSDADFSSRYGASLAFADLPAGPPRLFKGEINPVIEVGIYHFDYKPHKKYDFGFCRRS